jgi:6-phosphogluconolactonase
VVFGPMTTSAAWAGTFVYVGNADSNEIYVLALDRQRGDLTLVEKVLIPGIEKPGNSTPMALSPDRRVLYVGTRGEPKVAAGFASYSIDPSSGKLTKLKEYPMGKNPNWVEIVDLP